MKVANTQGDIDEIGCFFLRNSSQSAAMVFMGLASDLVLLVHKEVFFISGLRSLEGLKKAWTWEFGTCGILQVFLQGHGLPHGKPSVFGSPARLGFWPIKVQKPTRSRRALDLCRALKNDSMYFTYTYIYIYRCVVICIYILAYLEFRVPVFAILAS